MLRRTLLCSAVGLAAQTKPIRLVVQGDDMGAARSINEGTIRAFREGILTATNVMMPTAWVLEAVELLRPNPELEVGIHLTLTSEWTKIKWRPLTTAPSLVDANGYFFPAVYPRPGLEKGQCLREAALRFDEMERELRAQLELGKRLLPQATYLSGHMGFARPFPEAQAIVKKLASEFALLAQEQRAGLTPLGRIWEQADDGATRARKLAAKLELLEPGDHFTLDHASVDTPEARGMGHSGYDNVAQDRAGVLAAWTSEAVKSVVRKRGIQLITNTGKRRSFV
jgi:chitin disaccharide deacetylase